MKRRGNNEGSIRKRADGRWEALVSLPDGGRKSLYGKTRADVARKLAETLRDLAKGLPVPREQLTVEAYLLDWLELSKMRIRPSTWVMYESQLRRNVLPVIGHIALIKLTAMDLNRMYAHSLKAGLSTTTVYGHHLILHKALKDAMRADLISRNVAELDSPPSKRRYEAQTFTPAQARTFLEVIQHDRFQALYLLAIMTGMREGELLALTWPMVDFDGGTLAVRATHVKVHGEFVINEPKTSAGRRILYLNDVSRAALLHHWETQQHERARIGRGWADASLVFPDELGARISTTKFYQGQFQPLLRRAGLPPMRFHDLRHTAATLLLLVGIDATIVANMLGHASPTITQHLYQHVQPQMQRDASRALERLLIGGAVIDSDPTSSSSQDEE